MRNLSIILCAILLFFCAIPVYAADYQIYDTGYPYYVIVEESGIYRIYYTHSSDGSSANVLMCNFNTLEDALLYLETGNPQPTGTNQTTMAIEWLGNGSYNCLYGNMTFCNVAPPFAVVDEEQEEDNQGILAGIKELLEFPLEKAEEALDGIKSKFAFIENIFVLGDRLLEFFAQPHNTPPRINVNLGYAESKYDYGTTAQAIDVSWYSKTWGKSGICLKTIGDAVISAFLWIFFLWNLYKNLPNLIAGGSMVTEYNESYSEYKIKTAQHVMKDFNKKE